tara:strand:- start:56 stop:259 length:204 start_codon:yes stop_codon:yes gene_type:complete
MEKDLLPKAPLMYSLLCIKAATKNNILKFYFLELRYSDGVQYFNILKTLLKFSCDLNPTLSASASIE